MADEIGEAYVAACFRTVSNGRLCTSGVEPLGSATREFVILYFHLSFIFQDDYKIANCMEDILETAISKRR
jgi:hypothetical protein